MKEGGKKAHIFSGLDILKIRCSCLQNKNQAEGKSVPKGLSINMIQYLLHQHGKYCFHGLCSVFCWCPLLKFVTSNAFILLCCISIWISYLYLLISFCTFLTNCFCLSLFALYYLPYYIVCQMCQIILFYSPISTSLLSNENLSLVF